MTFWASMLQSGTEMLGNLFDNKKDRESAESQFVRNQQLQREFAQQGIRWRVEDAKAAGLHPLAALGASTTSFSPIVVDGGGSTVGRSVARGMSEMGQNLERSFHATRTDEERRAAEAEALSIAADNKAKADRAYTLDMQRKELENTLLASQIMSLNSGGQVGPAMPSGAGDRPVRAGRAASPTGAVVVKPSEVTSRDPSVSGREAGAHAAFRRYEYGHGNYVDLPGQALSESLEGLGWAAPFVAASMFARHEFDKWNQGTDKPSVSLPSGYEWVWNRWSQSWKAQKKGK